MNMEENTTAKLIVNKVFDEAQRVINMNITKANDIEIASYLAGMTAFFVAGYRKDFDLCQDITPSFQKAIMQRVTKDEYNFYSTTLNDAYIKFREVAITHQNQSPEWENEMMEEFGEMLLVLLHANATDYSRGLMISEAKKMLEIAQNTVSYISVEESSHNSADKEKPKSKRINYLGIIYAIVVVGAFLLIIYIGKSHKMYEPEKAIYAMRQYTDDNSGNYTDWYISIVPGKGTKYNIGTIDIYMLYYIKAGELPQYSYLFSSSCGFWEWKKILGNFAVNNEGKSFKLIPTGVERVDCYCSETHVKGIDWWYSELDVSDMESNVATISTIDFGNDYIDYEGTIFKRVSRDKLDYSVQSILYTLDDMLNSR